MSHDAGPFRPDYSPRVAPGEIDLHPRDMTATFSADVTLQQAHARLTAVGQWLPIDGDPAMRLGTMVERNTTGPLRLGFGAWRDLLLGCQFTTGPGQLITAGGRTVKNVAGLDLTKFMVGQGGTMGRVVTLTTRTYVRPIHALLASFNPDPAIARQLISSPCRPHWSAMTSTDLFCGFLGDARAIDHWRGAIGAFAPRNVEVRDLLQDAHHRASLWSCAGHVDTFRVSIPPMSILKFITAAQLRQWVADAAFGVVIGPLSGGARPMITQAVRAVSGRATFFTPDGCVIDLSPAERTLLDRIKKAFDPDRQLTGSLVP